MRLLNPTPNLIVAILKCAINNGMKVAAVRQRNVLVKHRWGAKNDLQDQLFDDTPLIFRGIRTDLRLKMSFF